MKIYKQIFSAEQTRTRKHHILTEEMLNDTGDWMETNPKKFLCLLTLQSKVSWASDHMVTQLLK